MAKTTMTKSILVALFAVVGLALVLSNAPSLAKARMSDMQACIEPSKATELRFAFRDLWTDHIFWVRNVVLETRYKDEAAAKVAEERVVKDAREIADAISPYYGREASDTLYGLLAKHYGAIKEYMNATFAGNKMAEETAADMLKKNADEIATFLSSANPNWPKGTLESALLAHGGHHMTEINEISRKDFSGDAKTWEAMRDHVLVIAGVLSDGIVKQFPDKF